LSAPPDPLAAIGGGVPTSKGREGNGKREGRGWERREGKGGRRERDPTPTIQKKSPPTGSGNTTQTHKK